MNNEQTLLPLSKKEKEAIFLPKSHTLKNGTERRIDTNH